MWSRAGAWAQAAGKLPQRLARSSDAKAPGCRIIAHKEGDHVHLWSRNGRDRSDDFVAIAEALRALPFSRVMLDGEAVAHCLDCRTFTSCRYHVA